MDVLGVLLCVLSAVSPSLALNEYDGNYENEIMDQQEGESVNAPFHPDVSRWDKLFTGLEDSSMRQRMLLDSMNQCCGETVSLREQLDQMKGALLQASTNLVSAYRAEAEQMGLRVLRGMEDLPQEEAKGERTVNTMLEMILNHSQEGNAALKRLEEMMLISGVRRTFVAVKKPSGTKVQDLDTLKRALVAIATELQIVHMELNKVIEEMGPPKERRGDT